MAKTDAAGQWAADDREGPSPCRGDDDDESSDDDDFANELEAGLVEEEEKRTILGKRDFDDVADSRGGDRGCTLKAARTTATTATLGMDGELRERPRPHVQHDGAPGLASLPSDLTTQVLRYLSPEDLTVLATTCRALRGPAVDDSLWRRCYCTRFGHPKHQRDETLKQARSGGVGGGSWRVLYFDDDARELRQAVKNTPPELSPIYAQMQAAKRSQAPDPAVHGDDVLLTLTDAERVSRWRAFKGLGDCTETSSSHHSCSLRLGCAFHRFGADIFVCEATGRAHVCDDACRERVVDMVDPKPKTLPYEPYSSASDA
jgi:hypothetical protein